MYKFRTLPLGAQAKIGGQPLSYKHGMTTPLTKFIRDTRLDELPQLFNILKGEMNYIGPRPVRPEVYEKMCKQIPGYDFRFSVKPGLIGFSQVFTPHSSPKRVRAIIDNQLVAKKRNIFSAAAIFIYTVLVVLKEILTKGFHIVGKALKTKLLRMYREIRRLERIYPKNTIVYVQLSPKGRRERITEGELMDINEEYFRFRAKAELRT